MNGWKEYEKLVLDKLKGLEDKTEKIELNQQMIREDIVGLKWRASIWGGVAGMIPVISALLFMLFNQ